MKIIKSLEQKFNSELIVIPILSNNFTHIRKNDIIGLYIYEIATNNTYFLNISHSDLPIKFNYSSVVLLLKDSVCFTSYSSELWTLSNELQVYDLNLYLHLLGKKTYNLEKYSNYNLPLQLRYNENQIIPISKHIEYIEHEISFYKKEIDLSIVLQDNVFIQYNDIILKNMFIIESNGICIDKNEFSKHFKDKEYIHLPKDNSLNDYVYTRYNLFTKTNRPTNNFGNINFNGLNKKTGEDKFIKSRYGDKGCIVEIDFNAYHLFLISKLINYNFPESIKNIHSYLCQLYLNKEVISKDEYKESKNRHFKLLYGGIPKEISKKIEFFKLTDDYLHKLYQSFLVNRVIESPITNSKIKNVNEITPNKLFNYLLQRIETEYNFITLIDKINKMIIGYNVKVIMYKYDSLVIDMKKTKKSIFIYKEILKLIKYNNIKYKINKYN
jgi:hypothetical protein